MKKREMEGRGTKKKKKSLKKARVSKRIDQDGPSVEPNHYGTGNNGDLAGNDANQYGTGIRFAFSSIDFDVNQNAASFGEG